MRGWQRMAAQLLSAIAINDEILEAVERVGDFRIHAAVAYLAEEGQACGAEEHVNPYREVN